jgi:arylsulfatase A-like enzyme
VSSYTAKSVAALLSGQYPSSLFRSGYFFTRYPDSNLFFPELLQQAGVHTMGAHAHMYMDRGNGMNQGFDDWEVVKGITFNSKWDDHITSDKLTALAIRQLDAAPKDRRFFMYVHYMDPHDMYMAHPEAPDWGHKPRDRYDQEIFFSDLWVGRLLDHCRKQPWWKQTAVIVTADHGEGFGEHGRFRHAFELWEFLVRVPLFFYVPGATARRIDVPRSHIDLAPTVLDLVGLEDRPEQFRGKTLVPELFGAQPEPRPVLLDLPADSNNFQRRALIDGQYKVLAYERDWRVEVYNVVQDPEEKHDLKKTDPEKYEQMRAEYQRVWSSIPKVMPFGGNKLKGGKTANGPTK